MNEQMSQTAEPREGSWAEETAYAEKTRGAQDTGQTVRILRHSAGVRDHKEVGSGQQP